MDLPSNSNPQEILDRQFTVKCPHCQTVSSLSVISPPRFELLRRFRPKRIGIGYRCNACNDVVFLRFRAPNYDRNPIQIPESFEEVESPQETFEYSYLPDSVASDFDEALTCYSVSCWNAFAAMCRRTIQSSAEELGSKGSSKVQAQIKDLKKMGVIEEETFDQLKQIMLSGHDGAHPHLPSLSKERAAVLLELMKDVLHELFVRKAKIEEAMNLRREAIAEGKDNS